MDPALRPDLAGVIGDLERRLHTLERRALPGAGADEDLVTAAEDTTATSYTDLATAGPAVTVTVGEGQHYLVIVSAAIAGNGLMAFEVSGAGTAAPDDADAAAADLDSGAVRSERTNLSTAGAAGQRVITAKYRSGDGATATFSQRVITAIPL